MICSKCHGVIPAGWPIASYMLNGELVVMHRFWTECKAHACELEINAEDVIRLRGLGVDLTR